MVRAVYEGRDSELVAHTPPLLWPTRTIRSGENGSQSRSVQSCPHLPTTREIYEPIVYQLGIADGIVKHGSAIGVSVFRAVQRQACGAGGGGCDWQGSPAGATRHRAHLEQADPVSIKPPCAGSQAVLSRVPPSFDPGRSLVR
jgi:hypothetical protein